MEKLKAKSSKLKVKKQHPITRCFFLPLVLIVTWLLCLLVFIPGSVVAADNQDADSGQKPDWISPPAYQYTREGKQNPFRSFMRTRDEQEQNKDKKKPRAQLGPLQKIAVTQLKLVGILWDPEKQNKVLAMVELPNGKGFVLKKGTKVGRQDGEVVDITEDSIIIEEEVISVLGEKETRTQVLELHASSGEK